MEIICKPFSHCGKAVVAFEDLLAFTSENGVPEEDDKRHADMVVRLQELVREAYLATNKACFYDGGDIAYERR